jgi:hypothetical protein
MKAFIRVDTYLAKAYDQGTDWRVLTSDGKEYWFSMWQADYKGSLENALLSACKRDFVQVKDNQIISV